MFIRKSKRFLRKQISRMDQYLNSAAVILMYHRISNISVEPNWLAVSPRNFAEHLEHIQQN